MGSWGGTFDARLGEEYVFEFLGEIGSVLGAVGCHSDAQRQGSRRDVVTGGDVEVGDAVVASGQAADIDLGTHAIDVHDKLHG